MHSEKADSLILEMSDQICAPPPRPERVLYFKRYRMEVSLDRLREVRLPVGFHWMEWTPDLIDFHAEVLFGSFNQQIDSIVFTSLGNPLGCHSLITELSIRDDFVPESTWLLMSEDGPCGTIQGLQERGDLGAIQNVGLLPSCQGKGLGALLVLQALRGFRARGLRRAQLEVTAENERAVQLYQPLGFKRRKTLYRTVVRKGES